MTNASPVVSKKSILSFWLCLSLLLAVLVPVSVFAAEPGKKTVRVGWYESPFNITDAYGGRSGYAYEYQQKIAAYTGWEYEYVKTSWPKLLEMLQQGEIDLLSDVSHTEERAKHMLYSALPMGEEEYYIFVSTHNRSVSLDNYATFDGKRAGVNKNSVQKDLYLTWAGKYGIKTELVEIGSTPFYFAVNQNRPDLLKELDAAMNRIQDENRFYNQQMYNKYFYNSDFGAYLTLSENDWLSSHGIIRVGYRSDYLPYCGLDPETGKLTGALQDYLDMASSSVKNAKLTFEPVPFSDVDSALEALKKGEIDCVFPVGFAEYDAEKAGVLVTDPPMHAEMYAVMRKTHRKNYSLKDIENVAYMKGFHYHESFLKKHFPRWKVVHISHPGERYQKVNSGDADCFLVSSYRLDSLAEEFSKYKLTPIATGVDMTLSFAVHRDNHQ